MTATGVRGGATVASLFSGIGGIELGLTTSGFAISLCCENWPPARAVLKARFDAVPVEDDVRALRSLPSVDLVTAGFPCSDLSQAGRMAGIHGPQSGIVAEVFRLLQAQRRRVPNVLFENVRNMISLHGGAAMRYLTAQLEALGYRWAYRVVDSRFAGVPQRRQRVLLLASGVIDPGDVLLADDAGEPGDDYFEDDLYGFYWTEGWRGLGWATDATPALKNGSTLGIASQPAIWHRAGERGARIVVPSIEDGERLQGFPRGWTAAAQTVSTRRGTRWQLVGNAVTVPVARWVGRRLSSPGTMRERGVPFDIGRPWPLAAYGGHGKAYAVQVSMWPKRYTYRHLREIVDVACAEPLTVRATTGFHNRATRSSLAFEPGFLHDVADHASTLKERSAS